jgi:acyl-CoA synthetase (AMP-forming)/AMP-acid ligase II
MVRTKLPAHAVPSVVHVVDALPRTPGGTVRRAALRERRANW